MSSLNRVQEMTLVTEAGARIEDAVVEAVEMAIANRCIVKFAFNDRPIWVDSSSDILAILRGWSEIGAQSSKLHGAYVQPSGEVKWGT